MDIPVPNFDQEDMVLSRIKLATGVSDSVTEGKTSPGTFFLTPEEVELTLDETPGFDFIVLAHFKDRRYYGDLEGERTTICRASMRDGQYFGDSGKQPLQKYCIRCENGVDFRRGQNPLATATWADGCKFHWHYLVRIVNGLPEDVDPPIATSITLSGMPGRSAAGTLSTILCRDPQRLYLKIFRARRFLKKGSKDYFAWRVALAGSTPKDQLEALESEARDFAPLLLPTSEPDAEGQDDLPI